MALSGSLRATMCDRFVAAQHKCLTFIDADIAEMELLRGLPLMTAFTDLFDNLGGKGIEIARIAAGDDAVVHDDFFIHPMRAGVLDILADRFVGGCAAALERVRLHQKSWAVADRSHDLSLSQEGFDGAHGVFVNA